MLKDKTQWVCSVCGEAENCDIHCTLTTNIGGDPPQACPYSGDEAQWKAKKAGG
jgi:hypothetical protein